MKYLVALLLFVATLSGQIPVTLGPNANLSVPAVDDRGLTAVVSSSVSPDGKINSASDLYLLDTRGTVARKLTNLPNNGASWIDLSSDGSLAAYNVTASAPSGMEEIHVVDTSSGADLKVAVDTAGCILPLEAAICLGCFFTCVRTVHFSPDASKVVYSASENQPLYVVNADGSGVLHLPIQSAVLAPSPQRVVSRNGLLVFTAGQDVYVVNLDGSGMQNLTNFPTGPSALNATISEDGGTVAFQLSGQIAVIHPGALSQAVGSGPIDSGPSISADGSLVAFIQAGQAFLQRTDGSSPPVRLTNFDYLTPRAVTLSGDGSTALVSVGSAVYAAAHTVMKRLYGPQTLLPNGISSFSGLSAPSAGSLVRIAGWNFLDDAAEFADGVPLPTSFVGISVEVNGQPIPLLAMTPSQITAQLPFTIPAGATDFAVNFGGGQQLTATAQVKAAAPEVLQYVQPFFTSIYAMAFHAGTAIVADQAHPGSAGEVLEMYGIGLGAVSPAVDAGMPGPSNPLASAIAVPEVKIGSKTATVTFAGLAPGLVGIDQVNAVVPSGLKSGSQPVGWSVSGQPPSVNWTIWVQ
jgi:uncharacterized protein (TIGR03437 family)